MKFLSQEIEHASSLFHLSGFADCRRQLQAILAAECRNNVTEIEATALLHRVNVERDLAPELETIRTDAESLTGKAAAAKSAAALYQLGIASLLTEDAVSAEKAFDACASLSKDMREAFWPRYGLAAVLHHQAQSELALTELAQLSAADIGPDFATLVALLKGNCFKGMKDYSAALQSYAFAQSVLPHCKTFYLKNWVFFGLASAQARLGEVTIARTLFETVLSITHPEDFRRLHKLATDELSRLEMRVEVLLDAATGDVVSNRGYLCLRRKPTLVALLATLINEGPKAVSKETLYSTVWKEGEYHPLRHDSLIYSHMQRLRQILKSDIGLGDFILTNQDGYRLNPHIRAKIKQTGDTHEN